MNPRPRGSAKARGSAWAASVLGLLFACSGPEFQAADEPACRGEACAGESGSSPAGSSSAGSSSAGSSASGGAGGDASVGGRPAAGAGAGGTLGGGFGGVAMGGTLNVGGDIAIAGSPSAGAPAGFPVTSVLDDFERGGGTGAQWVGGADNFSLKEGQLWCEVCSSALLWAGAFQREQEVFATLAGFDAAAPEMNLILRAQDSETCEQIEVIYSPASLDARVAYCVDGAWTDLDSFDLLLEPGQQFGGRLHVDDTLDVFVDGRLVHSYSLSNFPHKFGRIGVSGLPGDQGLFWDDFGGGNWN